MNYLQYKSDEMFSSTELIRKSKMIFDKLNHDDIEKAVILRDGKPSFLVMDFAKYEAIMQEFIELKEQYGTKVASKEDKETAVMKTPVTASSTIEENVVQNVEIDEDITEMEEDPVSSEPQTAKPKLSPREQAELDKALLELERVDKDAANKKREELKEFWD